MNRDEYMLYIAAKLGFLLRQGYVGQVAKILRAHRNSFSIKNELRWVYQFTKNLEGLSVLSEFVLSRYWGVESGGWRAI